MLQSGKPNFSGGKSSFFMLNSLFSSRLHDSSSCQVPQLSLPWRGMPSELQGALESTKKTWLRPGSLQSPNELVGSPSVATASQVSIQRIVLVGLGPSRSREGWQDFERTQLLEFHPVIQPINLP